jgi:hypothetical protein
MSEFGKLLASFRRRALDQTGGRTLSQGALANLLAQEIGIDSYSTATVSNWETGRHTINHQERELLLALIRVLHRHQGIQTRREADQWLHAGNYRALNEAEAVAIFGEGQPAVVPSQNGVVLPTPERPVSRPSRKPPVWLCRHRRRCIQPRFRCWWIGSASSTR